MHGRCAKLFLAEGRIVGFRLAGDTSGAGFLRSLMLRRRQSRPCQVSGIATYPSSGSMDSLDASPSATHAATLIRSPPSAGTIP